MKVKAFYSILISFMLMQLISHDAYGIRTLNNNGGSKIQAPLTYITGRLDSGELQDTMILEILSEFGTGSMRFPVDFSKQQVTKDGNFKFALPNLERPVYINLHTPYIKKVHYSDWRHHLLDYYLLMPGDSIHINYLDSEKRIVFSGKSAPQFKWQYDSRRQITLKMGSLPEAKLQTNPEQWLANQDTILELALTSLAAIKEKLRPDIYTILKADAIGMYLGNLFLHLNYSNLGKGYEDSVIANRTIKAYYNTLYNQLADTTGAELLASSGLYSTYLLNKAKAKFKYKNLMDLPHPKEFFTDLKDTPPRSGPLKEKMIMAYLYERIAGSAITDAMISDALKIVHNPRYRDMLLGMQETFGTGKLVEASYVFKDKVDKPVRLSDYKGKVIFVDMWFTGCAGCIAVAKSLPEVEKEFHNNPDVVFISLSIDKDKAKWMRSINGNSKVLNAAKTSGYTHYTTPGTKYIYTGGLGSNHPFIKKYNPTGTYPQLLLIDKTGRIFTSNVPLPVSTDGKDKLLSLIRDALNKK